MGLQEECFVIKVKLLSFTEGFWHAGIQTTLQVLFVTSLILSPRGIPPPPMQAPAILQRIKTLIYSSQTQLGAHFPQEAYLALYTLRQFKHFLILVS